MNQSERERRIAELTGVENDPLKRQVATVEAVESELGDVFDQYLDARIKRENGLSKKTIKNYHHAFGRWRSHMKAAGRHPACANKAQATAFIYRLLDGDTPEHEPADKSEWKPCASYTTEQMTLLVEAVYRWLGGSDFFGTHSLDFNPVALARDEFSFDRYKKDDDRNGNRLPRDFDVDTAANALAAMTHVRDRAIVGLQLLLGTRAFETANMQIQDLQIENSELLNHYDGTDGRPAMGSNPRLRGKKNAIVIPAHRTGNKSKRDRILPLLEEHRSLLLKWLLVRWDNGEPWLFLDKQTHTGMNGDAGNAVSAVWRDVFWPIVTEQSGIERPKGLSSHAGRHLLTSHFETNTDASPAAVDFIRGDMKGDRDNKRAADIYDNTTYEDITEAYDDVYRLGIV